MRRSRWRRTFARRYAICLVFVWGVFATACTSDYIHVSGNDSPTTPGGDMAFVVLNGKSKDGTCLVDRPHAFTGNDSMKIGNLVPPASCADLAFAVSKDDGFVLERPSAMGLSSGRDDLDFDLSAPLELKIHLVIVADSELISKVATATTLGVKRAIDLYWDNGTGIEPSFMVNADGAIEYTWVDESTTEMALESALAAKPSGDGPTCAELGPKLEANLGMHHVPELLNIYVLALPEDRGKYCLSAGPSSSMAPFILVNIDASPTTMAHEIGHALGLGHFEGNQYNLMRSKVSAEDSEKRHRVRIGQSFRMNSAQASFVHSHGIASSEASFNCGPANGCPDEDFDLPFARIMAP